ncbi:MAG TPA: aspartate-semialdehyde dehydrogenase [Chloroflexia bacterium]|nr:aspartate-semialdehyde dehydrogenase [Chloroflexia bacterium]
MDRIAVGVLGATGAAGSRLVALLTGHPWFEITALGGSERTAGRRYGDHVRSGGLGDGAGLSLAATIADQVLRPAQPDAFCDCRLIFSALPADAARTVEPAFAAAGYGVVSNASTFRMAPDVPLIVPEINADHLRLLDHQRRARGWKGFLVTNPNCSTIHLALALAPLHRAFGLASVQVTTLQALSGAGLHGVAGLDILDNVVPYIGGEEEKMEQEPQKLLGSLTSAAIIPARFPVSAQCTRVATTHGHLETVTVKLQRPATDSEVRAAWSEWQPLAGRGLPSAPAHPVVVRDEPDRPQPRLDRDSDGGMVSVVGRLRPCPVADWKFVVLGHNLVRGAAGGVLLIAELLHAEGRI